MLWPMGGLGWSPARWQPAGSRAWHDQIRQPLKTYRGWGARLLSDPPHLVSHAGGRRGGGASQMGLGLGDKSSALCHLEKEFKSCLAPRSASQSAATLIFLVAPEAPCRPHPRPTCLPVYAPAPAPRLSDERRLQRRRRPPRARTYRPRKWGGGAGPGAAHPAAHPIDAAPPPAAYFPCHPPRPWGRGGATSTAGPPPFCRLYARGGGGRHRRRCGSSPLLGPPPARALPAVQPSWRPVGRKRRA